MWNPPTSSPSPSGRSNGSRLVSPDHGDQVDHERREQQHPEPRRVVQGDPEQVERRAVGLRGDDGGGGQRPGVQEHRHERQRHRDLVADHLGRGAQAAEQRVRRRGGPAGQHDPVHPDRAHGQHQQHGHRQVGELQRGLHAEDRHLRAERDDREADEGRDQRDRGRHPEQQLVHVPGDDVLLQRQLERRPSATAAGRTARPGSARDAAASGRSPAARPRSRTASGASGRRRRPRP